jgi:hypothetical protein
VNVEQTLDAILFNAVASTIPKLLIFTRLTVRGMKNLYQSTCYIVYVYMSSKEEQL